MKKLTDLFAFYSKADPAVTLTLKFVLAGIIWILFSDSFLLVLGTDNLVWKVAHIHILKGLLFIAVSGAFFFYWANRYVQSLQQRENEVKNLFRSSPVAMAVMDFEKMRFLETNEAVCKLFDLTDKHLRGMLLSDFAVEKERFEAVPLLIKTGNRDLGTWQMMKGDKPISVDLCVQPVRDGTASLLIFTDVTNQLRNARDMQAMRISIEHRMNEQIVTLMRANEELAYRASQAEHVNAELIAVNEQLQHVNKKIALRAEDSFWKNDLINEITATLSDVFWSFDLTGRSKSYVSPSAAAMFGATEERLMKPWFWLDFVHPDDRSAKERCEQQLTELGQSACTYRILTGKGEVKWVFCRTRLFHDPRGIPMIIGAMNDITEIRRQGWLPLIPVSLGKVS